MSDLTTEDRKKIAHHLGMKPSEIVAAAEVGDFDPPAAVVQTHDGQRVLVYTDDDGKPVVQPWTGPLPGAPASDGEVVLVGEDGPELIVDEVPDGSVEVVLAWVGDDKDKAVRALAAENAREKPRTGLVGQLEKLAQA